MDQNQDHHQTDGECFALSSEAPDVSVSQLLKRESELFETTTCSSSCPLLPLPIPSHPATPSLPSSPWTSHCQLILLLPLPSCTRSGIRRTMPSRRQSRFAADPIGPVRASNLRTLLSMSLLLSLRPIAHTTILFSHHCPLNSRAGSHSGRMLCQRIGIRWSGRQ